MSKINPKDTIYALLQLSHHLSTPNEGLTALVSTEYIYNAWFTPESVEKAIKAIAATLNEADLTIWLNRYDLSNNTSPKKIGLILAGNIPLVGFHDVLCVLVSGNHAMIKASSQDARLIKHILGILVHIDGRFADQFSFVERLVDFDAVIATGSNNSSRYFDYYFSKVPHIIRKNRNSVALITGNESNDELYNLGHDIFDYFGLGCRNVSKLMIPKGYNLATFFEAIEPYNEIINHNKYGNNYGYNRSIYLVGQEPHLDNNFLILREDKALSSPLAVLFYEYYDDLASAQKTLAEQAENIQCVVSAATLTIPSQVVAFGQSQQPALWDYADGIDTMDFLVSLS
jgi:hypothetical protein